MTEITTERNPVTYLVPIVCSTHNCSIDWDGIRDQANPDESLPSLELHPGDVLTFFIPETDEGRAVGSFAVVSVVDDSLVDTPYLRIEQGALESMTISEDPGLEDEEEAELDFILYCSSCGCNCPADEGLIKKSGGNMRVRDPRPRKQRSSQPPKRTKRSTQQSSRSTKNRNRSGRR